MALSCPFKEDHKVLPPPTPLSSRWLMVWSLASCLQVGSQAPQHFRSSETQAICDGCFNMMVCLLSHFIQFWHIQGNSGISRAHTKTVTDCWETCSKQTILKDYFSPPQLTVLDRSVLHQKSIPHQQPTAAMSVSELFQVMNQRLPLNPHMPWDFFNTEYSDAKGFPVLANDGLLQKTTQRNTQPPLLWMKEAPLQRSLSAGCQNDAQLTKPVMHSEYGRRWV